MEERLQKILARCAGVSRRRAEELIAAGRVRVNGNTAQLGEQADAEEDVIELDGTRVKTRQEPQPVYLMLCKPRGVVAPMRDEKGRRAVAALVAARKLSDNQTLIENCDRLVNGKYKHFNNAGLGDLWYSLYLEEPKIKPQRQVQQRMY